MDNLSDFHKAVRDVFGHNGFVVSLFVAAIVGIARALQRRETFFAAFINMVMSGLAAPTIVWFIWKDAPFFVYGAIAAVCTVFLQSFLHDFFKQLPEKVAGLISFKGNQK